MNIKKFSAIDPTAKNLKTNLFESDEAIRKATQLNDKLESLIEEIRIIKDQTKSEEVQLLVQSSIQALEPIKEELKKSVKREVDAINESISSLVNKTQQIQKLILDESLKHRKLINERTAEQDEKIKLLAEIKQAELDITPINEQIDELKLEITQIINEVSEILYTQNANLEHKLTESETEAKIRLEQLEDFKLTNSLNIDQVNDKLGQFERFLTKNHKEVNEELVKTNNTVIENLIDYDKKLDNLKLQFNSAESNTNQLREDLNTLNTEINEYIEIILTENLGKKIESIEQDIGNINEDLKHYSKNLNDIGLQAKISLEQNLIDVNKIIEEHTKSSEQNLEKFVIKTTKKSVKENLLEIQKNIEESKVENNILIKTITENVHSLTDNMDLLKSGFDQNTKTINSAVKDFSSITRKVNKIQEALDKFNEKTILTEELVNQSSIKNQDPLTPLDQKFVTFDQLQKHYSTFINRVQQQLMTLGGGGSSTLRELDDVDFIQLRDNYSTGNGQALVYNTDTSKWHISNTLTNLSIRGNLDISGFINISGNLNVTGNATYVQTEILTVDDNQIILNNNVTGVPTENAGIEVERGTSTNVVFRWNESTDRWESTVNGTNYIELPNQGLDTNDTAQFVDTNITANSVGLVSANIGTLHANVANLNAWVAQHNTTSGVAEGTRLYYLDTRVWANVGGNIGNLNAWVTSHNSTTGIAEGTRLYYLDTRVWANVGANIGNLNAWVTSHNSTSGIVEGSRLYYLDTRVWSNVGANIGNLNAWNATHNTTSGITEGSRLYYTDERVWANVGGNIGNLNAWVTSHNTTSGITEGSRLYYTDERVWSNVSPRLSDPYEQAFNIQTNNFNAVSNRRYGVDTSSNTVTATLPATPSVGDAVFFADAGGSFGTNNLTIARNGNTINGSAANLVVNTNGDSLGLFWTGTTWRTYE